MRPLAVVAAALLIAAPAGAKPSCHAVTDGAHDDAPTGVLRQPSAMDIRWLDVANGRGELAVVLGLGDRWGTQPEEIGSRATVGFRAAGVDFEFAVRRTGSSDSASVTVGGAPLDAKAFTFRPDGTTVVWRVPRRNLKMLSKPKLTFTTFRVATSGLSSDQASGPGRTSGCVKAK